MKAPTEADLLNRKRAKRLGTILSNISIAAAILLFLSAFASVMVSAIAAVALILWFAVTICLLGVPLLDEGWRGLLPTITDTVEFGGSMIAFMLKLVVPFASVSISCAVLAPALLMLGAGENKSDAIPRTVISAIVIVFSVVCLIVARTVK